MFVLQYTTPARAAVVACVGWIEGGERQQTKTMMHDGLGETMSLSPTYIIGHIPTLHTLAKALINGVLPTTMKDRDEKYIYHFILY